MYTIQPCTSLQCHFARSRICWVHVCLVVACHLHFLRKYQDLLHASVVIEGCNRHRNKEPAQKVDSGENLPAAPART